MEFGVFVITTDIELDGLKLIDLLIINAKTHIPETFMRIKKTGILHSDGRVLACFPPGSGRKFAKKLMKRYDGIEVDELLVYDGVFNDIEPEIDSDEEKAKEELAAKVTEKVPDLVPLPPMQEKLTFDYSSGPPIQVEPSPIVEEEINKILMHQAAIEPEPPEPPEVFEYNGSHQPPQRFNPMFPPMSKKKTVDHDHGETAPVTVKTNFTDLSHKDIKVFDDLQLKHQLVDSLSKNQLHQLTRVQRRCFKRALMGQDLVYQSERGSGKTTLFVISLLQCIDSSSNSIQAVVVTCDLSRGVEVGGQFQLLGFDVGVRIVSTFTDDPSIRGNMKTHSKRVMQDIIHTRPHIIISSLEVLRNMVKKDQVDLSKAKYLVLDRLEDTSQIAIVVLHTQDLLKGMSNDRQLIISCETNANFIKPYYSLILRNPLEVILDGRKSPSPVDMEITSSGEEKLRHGFVTITPMDKEATLILLLRQFQANHIIVFVDNDPAAMDVLNHLTINDYNVLTIHSFIREESFDRIFGEFSSAVKCVLVTTGLFGRTLANVDLILNYDAPGRSKRYLERMDGCCMERGGNKQIVTFVCSEQDERLLQRVEEYLGCRIKKLPASI